MYKNRYIFVHYILPCLQKDQSSNFTVYDRLNIIQAFLPFPFYSADKETVLFHELQICPVFFYSVQSHFYNEFCKL